MIEIPKVWPPGFFSAVVRPLKDQTEISQEGLLYVAVL